MPSHRLACAPPIPHPANIRRSATGNRVRTAAGHCSREPAAEHCRRKVTTAPRRKYISRQPALRQPAAERRAA